MGSLNPGPGGIAPGPGLSAPMTLGLAGSGAFVGALDALPAPVAAYSVRRLLTSYVANKAINVRRLSDSAAQDFGFDNGGDLNTPALSIFLASTTGVIVTWYDQSGNGNDAAQATAANQPTINITDAAVGNRPSITFSNNSTKALTIPQAASHDGLFASANGGFVSLVTSYVTGPAGANRLFEKGAAIEAMHNVAIANNQQRFFQIATGNGIWITTASMTAGGHVYDIAYSSAILSNVPVFTWDAVAQGLSTNTLPTGTITSDIGVLTLGNSAAGSNGYAGAFSENIFWKNSLPSGGQPTTLRAGQKSYYRTP